MLIGDQVNETNKIIHYKYVGYRYLVLSLYTDTRYTDNIVYNFNTINLKTWQVNLKVFSNMYILYIYYLHIICTQR